MTARPPKELGIRYQSAVYRAHNPEWAWDPESGEGARRFGGRFNRVGVSALYTSVTVVGAIREASPLGKPFQPLTLCQYAADCDNILDTRDAKARRREKLADDNLTCENWRREMLDGKTPASHALADRLIEKGYAGMIVKSFAVGAAADEFNLVFWKWRRNRPFKLVVVDPDRRLPRDRTSWKR